METNIKKGWNTVEYFFTGETPTVGYAEFQKEVTLLILKDNKAFKLSLEITKANLDDCEEWVKPESIIECLDQLFRYFTDLEAKESAVEAEPESTVPDDQGSEESEQEQAE
jgi:hypothetical protein